MTSPEEIGDREEGGASWSELRRGGAVDGLEPPWPVAGVRRLTGHASTRRFFRLWREGPGAARTGATAVLVVYPDDDEVGLRRYVETAAWFRDAGVPVPTIRAVGRRAVLVSDGGDRLLAEVGPGGRRRRAYRRAVDVVARVQRHGLRVGSPNPGWALDRGRLRDELEFTEGHALAGWLGVDSGTGTRSRGFDRLASRVAELPTAVCHRDFHARNLLLDRGRLTVVDFQDAMVGPVLYDLASLVWDNYCDVPDRLVAEVLAAYRDRRGLRRIRRSGDLPVPAIPAGLPPRGRQAFCLVALQRHLKALGTFGYQVHRLGRERYAAWAPRTWRHARRCLEELGWDDLRAALRPFDRLLAGSPGFPDG